MRYVVLALLLSGCTHVSVQGGSSGGTTVTSTGVSVGYSASGNAAVWALIGIGLIAAHGGSAAARERGLEPDAPPARPMAPTRSVNEVDCTRPIEDRSANLKCK